MQCAQHAMHDSVCKWLRWKQIFDEIQLGAEGGGRAGGKANRNNQNDAARRTAAEQTTGMVRCVGAQKTNQKLQNSNVNAQRSTATGTLPGLLGRPFVFVETLSLRATNHPQPSANASNQGRRVRRLAMKFFVLPSDGSLRCQATGSTPGARCQRVAFSVRSRIVTLFLLFVDHKKKTSCGRE